MSYPAIVQTALTQRVGATATSTPITTSPGNLLAVILLSFQNTLGGTPLADNKGNVWVPKIANTGTTEGYGAVFVAENCLGGSGHTFTVTPSTSDFVTMVVIEIFGVDAVSAIGATSVTAATGTTHSSGNVTSDGSVNGLIIGAGAISRGAEGVPVVSGASWTTLYVSSGEAFEGLACGYRAAAPSTTDQFTYTTAHTNPETALAFVVKGTNTDPTPSNITQEILETFVGGDSPVNLTQVDAEIFRTGAPPAYLTQSMVEVWTGGIHPHNLTQQVIEVWYLPRTPPPPALQCVGCLVPIPTPTGEDESPCPS